MDANALVRDICDAAFVCDGGGRLNGWNVGAEQLLGYPAEAVLGKRCHDVICGKDLFGNRYCRRDCNVRQMIRRREAIHSFEFQVHDASRQLIPVACSVLALCETPDCCAFDVLHVLQPVDQGKEANYVPIQRPACSNDLPPQAQNDPPSTKRARLTRREVEVLRLLAQGCSPSEIVNSLSISLSTVRTHIENILRKLKVHNKLQAVVLAQHQHLI